MELLKGLIAIFIIYIIYLICDYYDCKNEKEKREQKELRDYFRPTPAKSFEEVEEWCKRQLERKCNK